MKLHIYDAADVTRSALTGVEVAALCGHRKVLTRELIDEVAAVTEPEVCGRCADLSAVVAKDRDVHFRRREGWLKHLERDAAELIESQSRASTRSFQVHYSGTFNWPLAG